MADVDNEEIKDAVDVDYYAVQYEESTDTLNMEGNDIAEILGLNREVQKQRNSIEHYDVDIDIYNDIYNHSSVMQDTVKEGSKQLKVFDDLHKDLFLSLFKYKSKIVNEDRMMPSTLVNNRIMRELVDNPEFTALRKKCIGDIFSSALGTESTGKEAVDIFVRWVEEEKRRNIENGEPDKETLADLIEKLKAQEDAMQRAKQKRDKAQGQIDNKKANGKPVGKKLQNTLDQSVMDFNTAKQLANEIAKRAMQNLNAPNNGLNEVIDQMAEAFSRADEEVSEINDMVEMWGFDESPTANTRIPFNVKKQAVERIRNSPKFKDLSKLIGRFREAAIRDMKQKSKNGAAAVKTVTIGNSLRKVLPSEKLLLCHPTAKKEFYRKFMQKQLLQYELESYDAKNRGPMVVCIDTSGSMEGTREKWSKALAIALLEVAHLQNRDYACIIFSGHADKPIIIEKRTIDPQKVMDIAERFHDGGTSFTAPLNEALNVINTSTFRKADITFITDGECSVDDNFLKKFNKTKEDKEFRVLSVLVDAGGGRVSDSTLKNFSDKIVHVSTLADLDNADSGATSQILNNAVSD